MHVSYKTVIMTVIITSNFWMITGLTLELVITFHTTTINIEIKNGQPILKVLLITIDVT